MKEDSLAVFFLRSFYRDTYDQLIHPFSVDATSITLRVLIRHMILMIHKSPFGVSDYLFIPPVDEHYEKWQALMMRPDEAVAISGVKNIL